MPGSSDMPSLPRSHSSRPHLRHQRAGIHVTKRLPKGARASNQRSANASGTGDTTFSIIIDWGTESYRGRRPGALFQGHEDGNGDHTGPSPVDRARSGSKHHLITDGHGTPLAVILTGGNRNVTQLLLLIDAIPPVRGRVGHPRHKPDPLFADRGYATTSTATRSDNVGSCRPSPAVAPSTAQDWAPTAGSWNAPSPGSTASNNSASAGNAEPTSTKPSSSWPAA